MDNKITDKIKRRFDHGAARQTLKERYQAKMIFADSGGMWKAGPELINLLSTVDLDELTIVDLYDTPITINRKHLLNLVTERWQEQLNAWRVELENLQSER